jgi:asparagine synthase (glutamine-hydrolysing)
MCGIAGIIQPKGQLSLQPLKAMTDALQHRGPDGEGHFLSSKGTVALGHRRLAILDLSAAAAQPFAGMGGSTIIHNGEIYNYIEIRNELLQKGFSFRTQSDTEVILAAYAAYGTECVEHFDGMFAFAIWNEETQTLFAARDRFGEKPFYFHSNASTGEFYFASEPKALKAAGINISRNETAWLGFLSGVTLHSPGNPIPTYFKDLYELPPGHFLQYHLQRDSGSWTIHSYKKTQKQDFPEKISDAASQLREQLTQSIQLRLRSDVSLGTSLSGGIDSGSITALIHQLAPAESTYSHKAFTAVFPGFEKDESVAAKALAQRWKVQQLTVEPGAVDFAASIEALICHHEEPVSSASVFAQYKVFELARQNGVKVLLDGQGADELLAGYSRYFPWFLQELLQKRQWSRFRNEKRILLEQGLLSEWNLRNYASALWPGWAAQAIQSRKKNQILQHPDLNPEFTRAYYNEGLVSRPVIRELNDLLDWTAHTQGLNELLRYADRNSMALGLEIRLPFLQHEMAEWLLHLPASFKIQKGYSKFILREAMKELLPERIVWHRRKTAFEPPQKKWMQQKEIADQIWAAKEKGVKEQYLNPSVLHKKNQPHDAYAADDADWRYWMAGILW